jgi:hypothetical protein
MILFSHENKSTTEFGVTKGGNYTKSITGKDFAIVYCTSNAERFLNWMCSDEIKEEKKQDEEKLKLLKIIGFWELHKASECFRGLFDNNHYQKVLRYKSLEFSETFTQSLIPKVKLKTIYPV